MGRVLPILFNTEMVRAILDGRKTVTRRAAKPRYKDDEYGFKVMTDTGTERQWLEKTDKEGMTFRESRYIDPPCQPGDILYVRETWCSGSLDYRKEKFYYKADDNKFRCQWNPSIHMPKAAARIWLRVTDVKVERLQDIDDDGVVAEGLQIGDPYDELWNSTIKKKDRNRYGWEANPWVWVIKFERCEK